MIVIGTDTHKRTHTCGAVDAATGRQAGELTAPAREPGFGELLAWARGLEEERIWAIEDCRHVSGPLERFLVGSGERVVRVPPKLTGQGRRGGRAPGKSDPIDALAVARAALREGPETLPVAHLDEEALQVKLLLDHRDDLVKARSQEQCRLRWHLHDLWPALEPPAGSLDRIVWLERLARRLARAEQGTRVRIARELVGEIRRRTRRIKELDREIAALVEEQAPALLELEGCGPLTAARLIAETAGAGRFTSDAKFARLAGVAPIPASSGDRTRHRLDRGGNRRLNCALHRIAVTQGRCHAPARDFLARKQAEGKSRREALRCLKRHLARRVWRLLLKIERGRSDDTVHAQRDLPAPQTAAVA
jgi:transposase